MLWVDWCIAFVVLISAAVGAFRGLLRELIGLLGWVLALGLSWKFSESLAVPLEPHISMPSVRLAVAGLVLFVGGLFLGSLAAWLVGRLVQRTPFALPDRLMGAGFGATRGVLFTVLFVMLAGLTPLKRDPWWQQSLFIGKLEWLASGLEAVIPGDWSERLRNPDPKET